MDDRRWRLLSLPVIGWILYDFAQTIFSFVVVTRYFNDWIIEERGQPDIYVGLMVAAVSVTLVVTLPLLGALADRLGRHKPILIAFTLLSVTATALLGVVDSILVALILAGIATFAFNVGDSQYHPLLSVVSPEPRRGRVSGIAVAIGYLGSLTALFLIGSFVGDGENQKSFIPAAAMFGLFALPLFVLVRERPRPAPSEQVPPRPFKQLAATLRRARAAAARAAAARALLLRRRDRDRARVPDRLRAAHGRLRRRLDRRAAGGVGGRRDRRRARRRSAGRADRAQARDHRHAVDRDRARCSPRPSAAPASCCGSSGR